MNIRKYINNISALQFFQLFRFGTLILIRVLFSKSSFSQVSIGDFEFFIFLAGALSFFWISGTIESLLPLYGNNNTFKLKYRKKLPELYNAFLLLSAFSIIIAFFTYLFGDSFDLLSTSYAGTSYLDIFILYVVLSSPANLIEYIYLLKNEGTKILIYGTIIFTLQLIIVGLPAILDLDMFYSILGLVFISAIRYVWLIALLIRNALFKFSFDFIKEHLQLAYPLIFAAFLSGSAQYIDGFLVKYKFDEATFAIFTFGAKELPLVSLLAVALSNALIPEFADVGKLDNILITIRNKSSRLIHLLFPLSIALIFSSKLLFPLVFNPDFVESAAVFNVYLLLIISRLIFPQTILKGLKKTRIILIAASLEIIINIGLSIVFINIWGIVGVAYATVIAYVIDKIVLVIYSKKKLGIAVSQYINVKLLSIYSFFLILCYFLVDTVHVLNF